MAKPVVDVEIPASDLATINSVVKSNDHLPKWKPKFVILPIEPTLNIRLMLKAKRTA